jgi:hypothetical protein
MTTSQITSVHAGRPSSGILLTEQQLADRWQMNAGSLANSRGRGRNVVPYVRIMSRVRYSLAAVEQYEASVVEQAAA